MFETNSSGRIDAAINVRNAYTEPKNESENFRSLFHHFYGPSCIMVRCFLLKFTIRGKFTTFANVNFGIHDHKFGRDYFNDNNDDNNSNNNNNNIYSSMSTGQTLCYSE